MADYTTLLVENDPLQREVLAEALRSEGLEVVECSTAEAAELVVATSGPELRAIIIDQNLEGPMLGSELAAYARQRLPALNIVLMSGRERPPLPAHAHFLQKPFSPDQLLSLVRV